MSYPKDINGYKVTSCRGLYKYDKKAAEAPLIFASCLRHIEGPKAGEPVIFEEWQKDIIRTLFGWKRRDGLRRFRKAFIFLPRKSGKTTMCAALALYVLLCDGEAGAQCYIAASAREQAGLLYRIARAMVQTSRRVESRIKITPSSHTLMRGENSYLRTVPAEAGTVHGQNAQLVICDELHTWKKNDFYDTLRTSQIGRKQPLFIEITTAGSNKLSLCYERYQYAQRVRFGQLHDDEFLPVIYELEEGEDWTDPENWNTASPNLGVSVIESEFASAFREAQVSAQREYAFRQLHLNQWMATDSPWLPMYAWERSAAATKEEIPYGSEVFGGLDLSQKNDLTALCWCQVIPGGVYRLRWQYWMPAAQVDQRERSDYAPYSQWIREGWIKAIPGKRIDYGVIEEDILAMAKEYSVQALCYDPWNAPQLSQRLEDEGLTMIEKRQSRSVLSDPAKEFEALVLDEKLDHGHNPVSNWMAGNARVKADHFGHIQITKDNVNQKNDGIVAAVMALSEAVVEREEVGTDIIWLDS